MFGIDKAKDRLEQLITNYNRLIKDPSNISLAEKVCGDAWHLNDWVFYELNDSGNTITIENFRNQLYNDCPEFKILHDIANTIKHKKLSKPKAKIQQTVKHEGSFDYTFDSSFEISCLEIILENGDKLLLDEILHPIIDYWIRKVR